MIVPHIPTVATWTNGMPAITPTANTTEARTIAEPRSPCTKLTPAQPVATSAIGTTPRRGMYSSLW